MVGGGKRRSMKRRAPISRGYIVGLLTKIDEIPYGYSVKKGLSAQDQRIRNKAVVSYFYESARRVSEIVGRKIINIDTGEIIDEWRGTYLSDIRYDTLSGTRVMIVNCRILKKGSLKHGIREEYADVILDTREEPFISHIEEWINYQRSNNQEKLFPLSRTGVYQILQRIDPLIVGPHWFRHQRLSHLAEALSPYQLTERIGFWTTIEPAVSYVHGRVEDYLSACERARGE